MVTLIRTLQGTVGAAAIPATPVTADDIALVNSPTLLEWLRGDQGLGSSAGWRGRKNDNIFSVANGALPVLTTGGQNGKSFVQASGVPQLVAPAASALLPANGSFSLAFIGNLTGAQTLGMVFGNKDATHALYCGFAYNTGSYVYLQLGGAIVVSSGATYYPAGSAPKLFVISFKYTSSTVQQCVLRVNGILMATSNAGTNFAAISFTNQLLTLLSTTPNAYPFLGALYDAFVYSAALHDAANAADLAALETYARNRYALW